MRESGEASVFFFNPEETQGHIKYAELDSKFQKYQGRVEKDDSGVCAVLFEQGSSASQMTTAKAMDDNARPLDCDGKQLTLYPHALKSKMEDAPTFLNIPKSGCPDVWIRLHDTSGQSHGRTLKTLWFLLSEICTVTHLLTSCWKDSSRKFYWHLKKCRIGNVFLFIGNKDCP